MSRLGIGIVGYGRIGCEHARWIGQTQTMRVSAVFDPTAQRRALAEQAGLRIAASLEVMLGDSSVQAILVCTANNLHYPQALAALRAGRHVMIEKPMTLDLAQAVDLANEAKRTQRVLSVFHNRRWDRDYLTIRHAIDQGVFGRVFNVESRLGQWASCVGPAAKEWRPGWRNESAHGGGGLYDWGSHFLDQIQQLLLPARPARVFAQLRGNVWTRECDDFARVLIDFDNGTSGLVEINTTTTRPLPRWQVDGAGGSASSPYSLSYDTDIWSTVTFSPADGGEPRELPRAEHGMRPVQIWERFALACRGEGPPAVTVESVLPTMALLDAARKSSHTGAAVPFSGDAEPG
jgi:predicted dehydrogenase